MAIGPVQFVVIGLRNERLQGDIERELYDASNSGIITILDALAVQKRQDGTLASLGATDLTPAERRQYGSIVGGLMGFGATRTGEGAQTGSDLGADAFAKQTFGLTDEEIRGLADDLAPGTTAVMVLFEHRWAVRLKEALERAGGVVLAQGMVRPETLMAFGENLAAASVAADQYSASQGSQQLN
ncbi:MAG: DUF1269 domain-containing protein [Ktedonobacterales bacterium]